MRTSSMHLNEGHLRDALTSRAGDVERDSELVDSVLAVVRTMPQTGGWPVPLSAPLGRRVPVILGIAALLGAFVAGALVGGQRLIERPQGPVRPIVYTSGDWIFEDFPTIQDGAIYGIAPDGSERIRLVDVPGNAEPFAPLPGSGMTDFRLGPAGRWSPDGSRIAFRLFEEDAGVYVMNADGSGLRLLAQLGGLRTVDPDTASSFAWAPDGSTIAFTSPEIGGEPGNSANGRLFVVDVATGRVTGLFGGKAVEATNTVAFSPDGAEIAFAREY